MRTFILVLVLFLAVAAFATTNTAAVAQTAPVPIVIPTGARAHVVCENCNDVVVTIHRSKKLPLLKVDLDLSGGVIGTGGNVTGVGTFGLGVEFRLNSWAGIAAFGDFGVTGGLLEGKVGSVWSTGLGAAFWPANWVRLAIGAGYEGIRNPSWNFSLGGPIGFVKADFLLGNCGFALGVTAAGGPAWNWAGDLGSLWSVSGGVRWFFGGPRR